MFVKIRISALETQEEMEIGEHLKLGCFVESENRIAEYPLLEIVSRVAVGRDDNVVIRFADCQTRGCLPVSKLVILYENKQTFFVFNEKNEALNARY